ncbi:MAG: ribosomal protein, partial [Sphingomonas bacterium]|nr:ribosomal protein [Sphingomonas bacterium]
VGMGKDHTLFALGAGRVAFHEGKLGRKFVSVDMVAEAAE